MKRILRSAVVVASCIFTLGGAASWGQVPSTNDTSAGSNTGGGTDALKGNVGSANTAYGFEALASGNEAPSNTATGSRALFANTTGGFNTASGVEALLNNATGFDNTASGVEALYGNTSGRWNTATGADALYSNSTGYRNTATGYFALSSNTSGAYNTALGTRALWNTTTGLENLALGYGAGSKLTSGNNNIYLGHPGLATESLSIRLGNAQTRTFIAGIFGKTASGGTQVVINSSGQLGTIVSSARYKRDIHGLGERSQGVHQLRPVTFRYKQDPQGPRQYGLIAEEVATVYPELVTKGADGKIESVQYHELIPMLLNEVQHEQQEIVELKAQAQQVTELRAQNESLRATLAQRDEEQRTQNAALTARLEQVEAVTRAATVASR